MTQLKLTPIDVTELDIFSNPAELRRDLHVFVDYVRGREVKRAHRTNWLSKSDAKRLAKLMTDPNAVEEVDQSGQSVWVDYVDWLALRLGFVSYDTKGVYAGYTSSEPSYPDNYIQFNPGKYQQSLELSLAQQEQLLLRTLLDDYDHSNNEFFWGSPFGRLSSFSSWGCATGVVPNLNFAEIRRFLLKLLAECQSGVWYSTASFVAYLRAEQPFFLIPQKPLFKDKWQQQKGRYCNFHESKTQWGYEIDISENEADAFERVEGRYLERFLENIPLTMGYVDVAYSRQSYDRYPAPPNYLKAFRVHERFLSYMRRNIAPPKVTVQPNFEIHVESEFYPVQLITTLTPLAEVISEDTVTILKLQKQKVAAHLVQHEQLDVVALLTELTGRALPQNVRMELEEWAGHSDKFTLYKGFGLLEGDENLPLADSLTVERITPALRIIRSPEKLLTQLERAELMPLSVKHRDTAWQPLPQKARTIFPYQAEISSKPKEKQPLALMRQTMITLHFPNNEVLAQFRKALLDARCPVEADQAKLTMTYSRQHEVLVETVFKQFERDYIIKIEDIQT